jgi:putative tryptophan/tyrosine transport system substrate-binding protein
VEHLRTLAEKIGITVQDREARTPQEMETAFNAIGHTNNVGGILVMGDAFFFANRQRLVELSLTNRMPLIVSGNPEFAVAGALMSYGASVPDMFRRSATYVDKILKGARPGDLPIEQPTKFDLAVNLRTAKALEFQIADKILSVADEVIE